MTTEEFFSIIDYIAQQGYQIASEYLTSDDFSIDYIDIFSQNDNEKEDLLSVAYAIGKIIEQPQTGITFLLNEPHITPCGSLKLVKVRFPDITRPQRGAPDFKTDHFEKTKRQLIGKENINLIKRPDYEMVEIWDKNKDVLVYFPSEPLSAALKI